MIKCISEYHVVEGDSISLPCNITKNEWTNGLISLIVWYRSKNQGIPIYSIDIRTQQQQQPLFENDNKKYNNNNNNTTRLYMDFDIDPPVLNLDSVQLNDNDDYRCRVDYRMNRTKQFLIHLNVLAIPKNVTIYDLLGNKIENGSLIHQPYNEGDKVVLYCDAFGGSPPPVVIWKYDDDNKIIDDTYEFINISTASTSNIDDNNNQMMMKTRNRLEILQIDRTFLLKEIICEAYPYLIYNNSNNNEKNSSKINQTIDNLFNSLSLSSFDKNNNKDKIIYHNHHHQQQQQQQQKHHHHHHHSFIQRTSIILDLNLRPLSVQIQVPNNFQPNLNRSTFSGTISSSSSSSSTSASMYMSVPSAFRLPSSSSSSSSLSSSLSTYNGNVLILSAGKKTEIECRTWGSRPPAEITWWRGSRRLPTSSSRLYFTNDLNNNNNNNSISNYNNDSLINVSMYQSMTSMNNEYLYKQLNLSISILTYISSPEDDGQRLTCRADNLQLEHEEIEDSVIISVRYAPLLTLSLGSKIPENIREGSDVYFECISKSNPPLTEVVWLFEGKPLINDPVQGILVTNQSLVMQRVNRDHRGNYQCAASNPEGISASNKVFLNVHFSPICKPTQTLIYGVARTEQIRVSCEVEAEPITPIQFRWYFNNSLENYELSKDEYTLEILQPNSSIEKSKKFFNNPHLLSQLSLENVFSTIVSMNNYVEPNVARSNATYSPRSRIGYGLLYCMAENSVGVQRDPCIFKIIEAGQPNSVHDCRIFNVTMTSFILKCIPGENGGLRQIFHLEVYNIEKEHLQTNVTRDNPVFEVDKLPPETAFILNVFSSNDKGRSDSVTLRTATRAYAEKHTTNGKKQKALLLDDINQLIINPIFGALIVALISLILLCLATIVFIRSRFCSKSHQSSSSSSNNSPDYNNQRDLKNDELNYLNENSTFDKHKNNEKLFVSFSNHSPTLPSTSLTTTTTTPMNHHNHPHHHHQQQQQQQQYLIRSSFTSEAPTFVEYHTHNSINDNTNNNIRNCTPMTDICSTILNKQTESNPYYVTTSTNNNNNDFIPLQHSMASSSRYSTATTTSTNSQSDLMTNAFTYNLAEAAPSVTTTNAIYPISNDLIKISSINCPFNNNHNNNNSNQTLSSRDLSSSILRPVTIENISSSLSNKTVDDEWPHLRSDINNTLIQSTTNNDNFQRQLTQLNIPP